MFLDSLRWLPGEEENFKFLNAYIAVSKKDRLCSGHMLSVRPGGSLSGHTCALIRGASRPRVGRLDEADWLFLQRHAGVFQGISRRALLPLVLGPPVHPSSLFQCPLPLSLARLLLVLLRNDCQASRQQRLNWFCCLSAHLCKKTVKSTPPGSLLPVASQDLRIKSILSP